MSNPFFERPIVNAPYHYPRQHWELDESGQPTGNLIERRRRAEFITPIDKLFHVSANLRAPVLLRAECKSPPL